MPRPIGATTGIISAPINASITAVLTVSGLPTKPRSIVFSSFSECDASFVAVMRLPSLPDSPTAHPPAALIEATRDLLMAPASTISTTDIVASSVTLSPFTKFVSMFSFSSILPICGPPPCTIIGRVPT